MAQYAKPDRWDITHAVRWTGHDGTERTQLHVPRTARRKGQRCLCVRQGREHPECPFEHHAAAAQRARDLFAGEREVDP